MPGVPETEISSSWIRATLRMGSTLGQICAIAR